MDENTQIMTIQKEPTILVVFGSLDDLTWRKLAPALYNLLMDNQLPERFAVIGLDKKAMTLDEFNERFKDGANQFCRCGGVDKEHWDRIAPNLSFISGDFC